MYNTFPSSFSAFVGKVALNWVNALGPFTYDVSVILKGITRCDFNSSFLRVPQLIFAI